MKVIATCILAGISLAASAQTTFQTIVSADKYSSNFNQLTQLNNSSLLGVGTAFDVGGGSIFTARLNANGVFEAGKYVSLGDFLYYNALTKTNDGGFAVSTLVGYRTLGLLKFDADMNLQWSKQFAVDGKFAHNYKLIQAADSDYVLAASLVNGNNTDGVVLRTDKDGNIRFVKKYFNAVSSQIVDVANTDDGNVVLLAGVDSTVANGTMQSHHSLVKIKQDGSVIWSVATSADSKSVDGRALLVARDGNIVVGGAIEKDTTISNTAVIRDQMLISKYSSSGSLLWSRNIALKNNAAHEITTIGDDSTGHYYVCNTVELFNNNEAVNFYSAITNIDTAGKVKWIKKYDNNNQFLQMLSFIPVPGGFIAGSKADMGNGVGVFAFYKYDDNVESCDKNQAVSFVSNVAEGRSGQQSTATADITVVTSSLTFTSQSGGIGQSLCQMDLPVQLLSFTADTTSRKVNVAWSVANDVNAATYTLERSNDGTAFTMVQQLAAKGILVVTQNYTATDANPLPGTSYYRLKITDKAGNTIYSTILPVTFGNAGTFIISPNPILNSLRLLINSNKTGKASFQVNDMSGRTLLVQTKTINEGMNIINLPANAFSKGIYTVRIVFNGSAQSRKFIKE